MCGECARTAAPVLVPDVHAHPDHIACDEASRAELVLPLAVAGRFAGMLDMDARVTAFFAERDVAPLRRVLAALAASAPAEAVLRALDAPVPVPWSKLEALAQTQGAVCER